MRNQGSSLPRLDEEQSTLLASRVGRLHLLQRQGIQRDHVARIFGRGRNSFHIENWYSVHSLMRLAMSAVGMRRRGQRNAAAIEVRHNQVAIAGLPTPFHGFRLLHLSDLHIDMDREVAHALIERVQQVEYEACVITGDFRARTYGGIQDVLDQMAQVRVHIGSPVYGVLGNHDFIEMVPGLEALGINVLLNQAVVIERRGERLHLAGIDDPHYYQVDNLEKAGQHVPSDEVSILLSHSPEIYRHAAHAGFDLLLCGHTHGGQICLPGGVAVTYNVRCPRRLCRGAWRYGTLQGYTSVGAGVCMVAARFNCPPEITLHELRRA